MVEVPCQHCGKITNKKPYQIKDNKKAFCNHKCSTEYNKKGNSFPCNFCNKLVHVMPSRMKPLDKIFCNQQCSSSKKLADNSIACHQCGNLTIKRPSDLKNKAHIFCSRKCLAEHQKISFFKDRIIIICEYCNKECEKPERFTKGSKGRFCSLECFHDSHHSIEKAEERFWKFVDKTDDCWLWTGGTYKFGHGNFKSHETKTGAHRFSWELHNGPIPDNLHVLHRCDVPSCIRPDHLFLGTRQDNARDMALKNRGGNSKWKIEDIKDMKLLDQNGSSRQHICDKYNISKSHLCAILSGNRRSHVD